MIAFIVFPTASAVEGRRAVRTKSKQGGGGVQRKLTANQSSARDTCAVQYYHRNKTGQRGKQKKAVRVRFLLYALTTLPMRQTCMIT